MRNPWLCILIVANLGLGAFAGTLGIIVLAIYRVEPPQSLVALVPFCYGALASFLVQPPRGSVGGGAAGQQQIVHAEKTTVTNPAPKP